MSDDPNRRSMSRAAAACRSADMGLFLQVSEPLELRVRVDPAGGLPLRLGEAAPHIGRGGRVTRASTAMLVNAGLVEITPGW
jgi:hypothetical protein